MRLIFASIAVGLSLTSTLVLVSGKVSAARAMARASATVVAPAHLAETLMSRSTAIFTSGTTGDLIIRVPTSGSSGRDGNRFRSAARALQTKLDDDCFQRDGNLTACFLPLEEEGLLDGDPVSSIVMSATASAAATSDHIDVTIVYN